MRYLRLTSYAMTMLGVALVALSLTLSLSSMWTVAGMLLVVAGIVKIAMIVLWTGVATVDSPPISREDV